MGRKLKDHRYRQRKNLPTWIKDRKRKTEISGEKRDLFEEESNQNKVLYSS